MAFKRQAEKARASRRQERGANLVEYALLLALIAIVCVGAVSVLGGSAGEPIGDLGSQLGE